MRGREREKALIADSRKTHRCFLEGPFGIRYLSASSFKTIQLFNQHVCLSASYSMLVNGLMRERESMCWKSGTGQRCDVISSLSGECPDKARLSSVHTHRQTNIVKGYMSSACEQITWFRTKTCPISFIWVIPSEKEQGPAQSSRQRLDDASARVL